MKKVVILMSAYNGEKYIREQINSILSQTYSNLELVVRDDGSTDSTIEILEEYSKHGKLSWYTGDNLKPAFSFLDLVKSAPSADYYAFADQDDVWDINKIEVAIELISKLPEIKPALYCSATRLVDKNLNTIVPVAHCKNYKITFGESLIQSVSPGCTFVFNRETRRYLNSFKSDFVSMHDSLVYMLVCGLGNVVFDKEPHISYRQHGGNVIGTDYNVFIKYKNRLKRFLFPQVPNRRLKMACALEDNFGELMGEKNKEILKKITGYRNSFKNKISLIINKEINMVNKLDNFFLKILILIGKV